MNQKIVGKRRTGHRRVWILYLFVAAVAVWGGYTYFFVQRPVLAQQVVDKSRLASQLESSRQQYQSLNQQIKELHQNDYIAFMAQKKYNLVKPGQILFVAKGNNAN